MKDGLGMINQTHLMCRMEHSLERILQNKIQANEQQKNSQEHTKESEILEALTCGVILSKSFFSVLLVSLWKSAFQV